MRFVGSEDSITEEVTECFGVTCRRLYEQIFVTVLQIDVDDARKRRIAVTPTLFKFMLTREIGRASCRERV